MGINKNIRNLLILGGVLVIVAGLMIGPNFRALSRFKAENRSLREAVAEQRQLAPVFYQLVRLARDKEKTPLPVPQMTSVSRRDIGSALDRLTTMATDRHLVVADVQTGLENFLQKSRRVRVQLKLTGDLRAFQHYLLDVAKTPYVEVIETVGIHAASGPVAERSGESVPSTPAEPPLSYDLTLWIAVKAS